MADCLRQVLGYEGRDDILSSFFSNKILPMLIHIFEGGMDHSDLSIIKREGLPIDQVFND